MTTTQDHKTAASASSVVAFSIDTCARRIGVSRSYLWEQVRAGKLKSFKLGKRRLTTPEFEAEFLRAAQEARAA